MEEHESPRDGLLRTSHFAFMTLTICVRKWETNFIQCGCWEELCSLSMRVVNCSPILDKILALVGPETLYSTGAGVWRKAPEALPDSSSVLNFGLRGRLTWGVRSSISLAHRYHWQMEDYGGLPARGLCFHVLALVCVCTRTEQSQSLAFFAIARRNRRAFLHGEPTRCSIAMASGFAIATGNHELLLKRNR